MINPRLTSLVEKLQEEDMAALTVAEAVESLNTEVVTGYREYFITDRMLDAQFGVARAAEIMAALDTAAAAGDTTASRAAELLRDRSGGGLDLGSQAVRDVLPGIVSGGIMTQAEIDQLIALAEIRQSAARQLVGRPVPESWVVNIRAAIAAGEV